MGSLQTDNNGNPFARAQLYLKDPFGVAFVLCYALADNYYRSVNTYRMDKRVSFIFFIQRTSQGLAVNGRLHFVTGQNKRPSMKTSAFQPNAQRY